MAAVLMVKLIGDDVGPGHSSGGVFSGGEVEASCASARCYFDVTVLVAASAMDSAVGVR
jgi:hypothetical protein